MIVNDLYGFVVFGAGIWIFFMGFAVGRRMEAARWRDAAGREPNYEKPHTVFSDGRMYTVRKRRAWT